MQKLRI